MKTEQLAVLGIGLALVAAAAYWEARVDAPKRLGAEITPESLKIGEKWPRIWLFYNDSEVNAREWYDFGARSSRVINIPLLNTLYEKIVQLNGDRFKIEVIAGLDGAAQLLGGWDALPRTLRVGGGKARVSTVEEDWIRTAVLARYGGLWLSPCVIPLKPFAGLSLPPDRIVAFGQDDEPLQGSPLPAFRCLWVPGPNHSSMVEWEEAIRARMENQTGGQQIRGDIKSDWLDIVARYGDQVEKNIFAEQGRDGRTNKKLQLEDIFATGTEGRIPFTIRQEAVYIPIPYRDLLDRRHFGWLLRSSEEQILESDLVISHLLK